MYVTGTLLVNNSDYLQSVSAVDMYANGGTVFITYLDSNGRLKAGGQSLVQDTNGNVPTIMSGCDIVQ